MHELAKQIHKLLRQKFRSIAVAESCTGGQLSQALTSISGSSRCFLLGIVAYSNFAKNKVLKVPYALIDTHGAVSRAVARKMAQNVSALAKADLGISITGIAGPTGGTKTKPVGTVFIAIAAKNKTICKRFNFKGNRTSIRKQATKETLKLIRIFLAGLKFS